MKCKFTIDGDMVVIETNEPKFRILRYTIETVLNDLKYKDGYGSFYREMLDQFSKEFPEFKL